MTAPTVQVYSAMHTRLTGFAALTALLASSSAVYSHVEQGATKPYVSFGAGDDWLRWNTKTDRGWRVRIQVDVWTEKRGPKTAYDIIEQIVAALQDAGETWLNDNLTGYHAVSFEFLDQDVIRDPDGVTFHGFVNFDLLLETA